MIPVMDEHTTRTDGPTKIKLTIYTSPELKAAVQRRARKLSAERDIDLDMSAVVNEMLRELLSEELVEGRRSAPPSPEPKGRGRRKE